MLFLGGVGRLVRGVVGCGFILYFRVDVGMKCGIFLWLGIERGLVNFRLF